MIYNLKQEYNYHLIHFYEKRFYCIYNETITVKNFQKMIKYYYDYRQVAKEERNEYKLFIEVGIQYAIYHGYEIVFCKKNGRDAIKFNKL